MKKLFDWIPFFGFLYLVFDILFDLFDAELWKSPYSDSLAVVGLNAVWHLVWIYTAAIYLYRMGGGNL